MVSLGRYTPFIGTPDGEYASCQVFLLFLRFVIATLDEYSGRRQGVFQQAYTLRDSNAVSSEQHEQLNSILRWFDGKLAEPERFTRGSRKGDAGLAISWFKDTAREHIAQMRTLCRVLDEHGTLTETLTTNRPGYIVFEDDYQIAAVPFADTPT